MTWAAGDCLPSSGTLDGTSAIFPLSATITFLATTPDNGVVEVEIGGFENGMALQPPCA